MAVDCVILYRAQLHKGKRGGGGRGGCSVSSSFFGANWKLSQTVDTSGGIYSHRMNEKKKKLVHVCVCV